MVCHRSTGPPSVQRHKLVGALTSTFLATKREIMLHKVLHHFTHAAYHVMTTGWSNENRIPFVISCSFKKKLAHSAE